MRYLPVFLMILILGAGGFLGISAMGNPSYLDPALWLSYVVLGLAILLIAISAVIGIAVNPAGLKKTILSIAVLVILGGIAYAMSSSDVLPSYGDISPSISRFSETIIILSYFVAGGAIIALVIDAIKRFF